MLQRIVSEMKRYLPVIEALEKEPELWERFTKGTGIATANGYRNAIKQSQDREEDVEKLLPTGIEEYLKELSCDFFFENQFMQGKEKYQEVRKAFDEWFYNNPYHQMKVKSSLLKDK
jgi:hypothetical protein